MSNKICFPVISTIYGALDTSLSEVLNDYYTKKDIDSMGYVDNITILPGTVDGTIR